MIEILTHLFFASFWIFGVRTLFSADHILYPAYEWAEKNLNDYILKPTIGCVMCMSSLHGAAWYFIFLGDPWYLVFPFMICLCGLNSILDGLQN